MTPSARIAAAIEVLDAIIGGQAAEQALTRWARGSRYAGSKDRAAVRDHVFDALRNWRSDAIRGGGTTGRARMLGRLRAEGVDPAQFFSGEGYSPAPLSTAEVAHDRVPEAKGDLWDLPDWLLPLFEQSLGEMAKDAAQALRRRAPITLRVNVARTDSEAAQDALASEGIATVKNPRASTALSVTEGARKIRNSTSFADGLVELQDASSQAAVEDIAPTGTALDYCAGGGGKSLALAALGWRVTAHDADPVRMKDIPVRAQRAGHQIAICSPEEIAQAGMLDLVLVDAPCSGSGTWRRTPDAKWALTPERLDALSGMQTDILNAAAAHVAPNGVLVYATCSVLNIENQSQIDGFLARNPDWELQHLQSWAVDEDGDGFFAAHLTRQSILA